MFFCKKLKLLYAIIVMLLEIESVNTGAMKSKRSSILVAQNADDLRSLDMCTSRNQERLGSVFGNFTRHHKKGHRRRTTTSTPITTSTTKQIDIDSSTEKLSKDSDTSTETYPKLPKPLRLSSQQLDIDTIENVHKIDNILLNEEIKEIIARDRLHKRYEEQLTDINKELLQELHEDSMKKSLVKVKKMYRDSTASSVNKVNSKGKREGIFLTDNCTTVVAQIGTTAVLHCEVSDITENTVTWIRKKDYSLLSVGLVTYSADNRFFSAHGRHVKDWALHIKFASLVDAGYYECQVPTHPPTSIFFKLILVAAYAEIMGESEKIIHEGSMLRLVCVVRRSTEPPSYVFWYFENRMINYDLRNANEGFKCPPKPERSAKIDIIKENVCCTKFSRPAIYQLHGVSVHNGRQTSELVISRAEPKHAGNYTCVPANAKAASVTVHVVQSETPAAMQHGNNSSASKQKLNIYIFYSVIYFIAFNILLKCV